MQGRDIIMDYLDQVAEFAANTPSAALPPEVIDRTTLILADCLGAIAGGAAEPEMQRLSAGAQGTAVVIGTALHADPARAAFLNGTAGTVLEMDEGNQFCKGHPGMHTVPAALAFAGGIKVSGRDLLSAIAIGYEVGARIGIATQLRPAMHPHGTWGTVAAAVAVARLAGRDAAGMRHAMNIAASFCLATSRRTMLEGGTVRNAYAGISGQMGLTTHDLLTAGFEGDHDGVGQVFGKVVSDRFNTDAMVDGLGTRWEVSRNYFKMHSCCRYNHATLDALAMIVARDGPPDPARIVRIEVETYSLAVELDDASPRNTLAAKFSVPFAVATALVNGSTEVGSFTAPNLANPAIRALAAKVVLREDMAMTAALPHKRPARVTLIYADGNRAMAETQTNRGDWADPYPVPEIREKFLSLTTRVWAANTAAAIWDATLALAEVPDARALQDQMSRAGQEVR
jgi:2-methylcitrate dehydratase PrpD